jgi:TM2 domain-containing membrane protein YozV
VLSTPALEHFRPGNDSKRESERDTMSRYYLADGMVQRGPFAISDLPGQGLSGRLLVWKEGMPQWRRADQVDELIFAGVLGPPMPSYQALAAAPAPHRPAHGTPAAAVSHPSSSTRIAAGVCGIVLGAFGVHKFILGTPLAGVIMLLLTVLTCGWLAVIPSVIGLIEGIIYLTRSDDQFHAEYVLNKKAWF